MDTPPFDPDNVQDGDWLEWSMVWDLVPLQASNYYKKFRRYFVGNADDLAQSAYLALLTLQSEKGVQAMVRERPTLQMLHNAMLGEIKGNRRESANLSDQLPLTDKQLSPKQVEILDYWRRKASRIAKSPYWMFIWFNKCLEWTPQEISLYYQKASFHHNYSEEYIEKGIKLGLRRLTSHIKELTDINLDLRHLQFHK